MTPEQKKEAKRLYDIEYRKRNSEKIKEQKKVWYNNLTDEQKKALQNTIDKENKKLSDKKYAFKNKDKLNLKKKAWAKANPEKNRLAKTNYVKKKMSEDPLYKFKHNISCSIRQAFKRNGYSKNNKSLLIIGCTFEEFKKHIESLWESWMNWDNYGKPKKDNLEPNKTWDLDHIIPLSTAKTEDDVIRLNHYTNLQPLCSYFNQKIKRDKY